MKIAFLFPGQGAQTVGMGQDVFESVPAAQQIFATANEVLGFDLQTVCFAGPAEQLNTTVMSQPAIFTVSAALLAALRANPDTAHIQPTVCAGLSLGEYTALYAAGVIGFADALSLVQQRGQAMQAAADASDGAMVSLIGLSPEDVKRLCAEAAQGETLEPANFNCPGQIVVSGTSAACARVQALAPNYDAIKAIRLEVAGAFHTEMMASAGQILGSALENTAFKDPSPVRVLSNVTADYYPDVASMKPGLVKQLTSPILWQGCMEKLLSEGIEAFYEIGPGRVLTGLMRRINRKTRVKNVSTLEGLQALEK